MQILYKIVYHPFVNLIIRHLLGLINKISGKRNMIGLSGVVPFRISEDITFYLETNPTSPMSIVYWNNPSKFEFTPIFKDLVKDCKTFFDIGSNLGFYSFLASKSNPDITVHAFEPSNGAFHYLKRNVAHNHVEKNVFVHKIALSNSIGTIEFFQEINPKYPFLTYHLSGIGNTKSAGVMRKSTKYLVPTLTLDEFVRQTNPTSIDLIKMDTEGTESLILAESSETIQTFKPIFIIEILDDMSARLIEDMMKKYNYHIFQYSDRGLLKISKIIAGFEEKERNFFFVPDTKLPMIHKYVVS